MSTYYVRKTGSGGGSGSTGSPKLTFAQGLPLLSPGDELLLGTGDYDESLSNIFPSGVSWSNKIRIAAEPGATVWLRPSAAGYAFEIFNSVSYIEWDGIHIDGTNCAYGAVTIQAYDAVIGHPHHIRLQNFEVIGNATSVVTSTQKNALLISTYRFPAAIGGHEIRNLTIHRTTAYGIYLSSANCLVENCNVYDCNDAGIHVSNSTSVPPSNNIVRNNWVHDIVSSYDGRIVGIWNGSGAPSNNLYANNLVTGMGTGSASGNAGIQIYTGSNNKVYNNTVTGNGWTGIWVDVSASGTDLKNNVSWGNGSDDYIDMGSGTSADSSNDFGTDPLFVNAPGNVYTLREGSSALGTGSDLAEVTTDIVGTPRPSGAYDKGAYQGASVAEGDTVYVVGDNSSNVYTGVEDTMLIESLPTTAAEGFDPDELEIKKLTPGDYQYGLIRFAGLSDLPVDGVVTSAVLTLYLAITSGGSARTITARRCLRAWDEATATFNKYDGTNDWATPGGLGSGSDRSASVAGTMTVGPTVGVYQMSLDPTLVDDWRTGAIDNDGIHLERTDSADDSAYDVLVSRNGADGQRPYLTVTISFDIPESVAGAATYYYYLSSATY